MPFDPELSMTSLPAPSQASSKPASAIESALQLLIEGDFQMRWEATKRLSACGKPAITHLVSLLKDDELDWEIRWFVARALGDFEDPDALEALIGLVERTDEYELIAIAAEGLSRAGAKGVDALVKLFDDVTHRITAVQALATIRDEAVLQPLLTAAKDSDPSIRAVAVAALGNFREDCIDALLIEAVADPAAIVRQEAVMHLGWRPYLLNKMNLVDILMPGLWDSDARVNKAAAMSMGRLGTETAIANLARVLRSPDTLEPLQKDVVRSLGWIDHGAALLSLLSARPLVSLSVQLEIVETLTRFESTYLRRRAGAALCAWLTEILANPEADALKQAIALALGDLQPAEAHSLLSRLSQEANQQTALYAEAALRKLAESSNRRFPIEA